MQCYFFWPYSQILDLVVKTSKERTLKLIRPCYKTFNGCNYECSSQGRFVGPGDVSSLVKCLYEGQDPTQVEIGSSLLENIRLDWKGLPRTNAMAYYEHL